jgi:hypothetical protein
MGQESETRQMNELTKARWICVDEYFCTEFGEDINHCIQRYKESMDEKADVTKLTFYSLDDPYQVEVLYTLRRKTQ